MDTDVLNQIELHVRGGFAPAGDIVDMVLETCESEELDHDELHGLVRASLRELRKQARAWPEVTDCDRLDVAFRALCSRGVIALQNAGYTQSDGYHDVGQALRSCPEPAAILGYCFFHGQDLERAVNGDGVYLAFGPIDPNLEQTVGPQVGKMVIEELGRAGLESIWNGSFGQRILVPKVDWKKRRSDW